MYSVIKNKCNFSCISHDFDARHGGSGGPCWVGGYSTGPSKTVDFAWADGSKWDFTNWREKQPDKMGGREWCVHINFGGRGIWNDINCDGRHNYLLGYICQMNPINKG